MARKKFKCPKCDRRFSMAAHLARHVSTIHRRNAKKQAPRRAAKRAPVRRRGQVLRVQTGSSIGAAGVLASLRTYHEELSAQVTALDSQMNAVAGAMQALGTTPSPRVARPLKKRGGGGDGGRAGSLKDFIVRALRQVSTPQSPRQIAARVKKIGYKSKAKDLAKAVGNALPLMKRVKKVGFGKYRV